jgi:hypothetical protein
MKRPPLRMERLRPRQRLKAMRLVSRAIARRFRRATGATAVGVGLRQRRRRVRDEWCAKFYVQRKSKRPGRRRVPKCIEVTIRLDGRRRRISLPTDVVETRHIRHHGAGGAYLANHLTPDEVGTPCALVRASDGMLFFLTAGPVAARNREEPVFVRGEQIDADADEHPIGSLAFAPSMGTDSIDAALVEVTVEQPEGLLPRVTTGPVRSVAPEIAPLTDEPFFLLSSRRAAPVPMRFVGIVVDMQWDFYAVKPAVFREMLHFTGICKGGDSGSLIVDSETRAVAMHLMGRDAEAAAAYDAYAVSIATVLGKLRPRFNLSLAA